MSADDPQRLGITDRWSLYVPAALAALAIVASAIATVHRLVEVATGGAVAVLAELPPTEASAPLGPSGTAAEVSIESATVTIADPSGWTLALLWIQPLEQFIAAATLLTIAAAFLVSVARGRTFHRRAGRLAFIAAIVVAVHWLLDGVLRGATSAAALTSLDDQSAAFALHLGFLPLLGVIVLGAISAALERGHRLERDVEGLV